MCEKVYLRGVAGGGVASLDTLLRELCDDFEHQTQSLDGYTSGLNAFQAHTSFYQLDKSGHEIALKSETSDQLEVFSDNKCVSKGVSQLTLNPGVSR